MTLARSRRDLPPSLPVLKISASGEPIYSGCDSRNVAAFDDKAYQ